MADIRLGSIVFDQTIESDHVKGKKVLANNGREIGSIKKVLIGTKSLQLEGLLVERGFFSPNLLIGREYIETLNERGAILKITPVTEYRGLKVFDADGKQIGRIRDIRTIGATNNIAAIVVSRGWLSEDLVLPRNSIYSIGESVLLTVKQKEL